MEHVAILKKSWNLLDKIIRGEKTVESRWYVTKRAPWDTIKKGDTVYFKNSGDAVRAQAKVVDVQQFAELTPKKIKEIIETYGDALGMEKKTLYDEVKDKKYCILIFLDTVKKVTPFHIEKKGFGNMAAWITAKKFKRVTQ